MANRCTLLQFFVRSTLHIALIGIYIFTIYSATNFKSSQSYSDNNNNATILNILPSTSEASSGSNGRDFGGTWKFLTSWNFALQILFFGIAILMDFCLLIAIQSHKFRKWFRRPNQIFSGLFHSLVFPLALWVSLAFWSIYFYDRELIFPVSMDHRFPSWINHMFHTLVSVAVILEFLLVYHQPPNWIAGLACLLTVFIGYGVWTFYLGLDWGIWAYPFLRYMSWVWRIVSFIAFTAVIVGIYVIGIMTHPKYWNFRFKHQTITRDRDTKKSDLSLDFYL